MRISLSVELTCQHRDLAASAHSLLQLQSVVRMRAGVLYSRAEFFLTCSLCAAVRRQSIFGLKVLPPESWICVGNALVMLLLDVTYSAFIVSPRQMPSACAQPDPGAS